MVEPDLVDTTLEFGSMRMGPGRAFVPDATIPISVPQAAGGRFVPVSKCFENIGGRNILIEGVEYQQIQSMLSNLPPAGARGIITNASARLLAPSTDKLQPQRNLPIRQFVGLKPPEIKIAQATQGAQGPWLASIDAHPSFTLDYDLVQGPGDYTMQGNTTYLVNGFISVNNLIIQGGAVIKAERYSYLMASTVRAYGDSYLPIIFTARDDNSVGENVSTGPLSGLYPQAALIITEYAPTVIEHLRISYAEMGILYWNPGQLNTLRHVQFTHCRWPAYCIDNPLHVENALFDDTQAAPFYGDGENFEVFAAHITADGGNSLSWADTYHRTITLVNSLIVGIPEDSENIYIYDPQNTFWSEECPPGLFATAALGEHYLAENTYQDQADPSSVDPALLQELQEMTTKPPIALPTSGELLPQDLGDLGQLDLGYHYPIIDYYRTGADVTGALTIKNGAVIGVQYTSLPYGLNIRGSGSLLSEGTPLKPNVFLRMNNVQEQKGATPPSWHALITDGPYGSQWTSARFRFTEFCGLAGPSYHFYGGNYLGHLEFLHSRVRNGRVFASYYGLAGRSVGLTNTLWENVSIDLTCGQPL